MKNTANTANSSKELQSSGTRYAIRRLFARRYLKYIHGNVLDIGCGNGEFVSKSGITYYGVDVNPDMATQAMAKGIKNIVHGDARRLPYVENRFDTVLCFNLLEQLHDGDGELVIEEAYRVLKPGGIFILVLPDRKGFDMFPEYGHITFWPQTKALSELALNGFDIKERFNTPIINIRKFRIPTDLTYNEQVFVAIKKE